MNKADSERLESALEQLGLRQTPVMSEADVIVLNSCVVRQSAEDKVTGTLGLVTVLPSEGAPGGAPLATIIISFTSAAGCQAAVEFLSPPGSLHGLKARLHDEGRTGFPPAYQTVIRSPVFQSAQATPGEYVAHVAFQP